LHFSKIRTACNGGAKAKALCVGYIEGVLDYDLTRQVWHRSERQEEGWRPRKFSICSAFGTTGDQTVKIVTKFLNEHPEELHSDASSLENRYDRIVRKMDKIEARYFDEEGAFFYPKKGMHRKTFDREYARWSQLNDASDSMIISRFARLF